MNEDLKLPAEVAAVRLGSIVDALAEELGLDFTFGVKGFTIGSGWGKPYVPRSTFPTLAETYAYLPGLSKGSFAERIKAEDRRLEDAQGGE